MRTRTSFADAKAREDLSEQVIGGKLARDAGERDLREPQLLGEEFPLPCTTRGSEMPARGFERAKMALAGQEYRFAGRIPAGGFQDRLAQPIEPLSGLGGDRHGTGRRRESRHEIYLVIDIDARCTGGELLQPRSFLACLENRQ